MKMSVRRVMAPAVFFLGVFFLCLGMGGKPLSPDDITAITKINIADREVIERNKPIIVSFSEAMVPESALNAFVAQEDMPFSISPEVKGQGIWLTQKSFSFSAKDGYPRGRQYHVLFRDDLRSLSGKPVRHYFSFNTEPVRVRSIWPGVYSKDNEEMRIVLGLSMPVSAKALGAHLSFKDADSGEKLEYTLREADRDSQQHEAIVSLGKFRPKIQIEIAQDTPDDKNPLGFFPAYNGTLTHTLPGGGSESVSPAGQVAGGSVLVEGPSPVSLYAPYATERDEGSLSAYFALTQRLASDQDYKKYIEVIPEGLEYSLNADGSALVFDKDLEPGLSVSVKLLPGLVDASGRVLKEERSTILTLPDYRPSIRFADHGSYLTPVYGGRAALNMRNIDRVGLTFYRQYDNNLPFMNLSGGNTSLARNLAYKEIDLDIPRNETGRRSLDLESLAQGQRGIFIVELAGYTKRQGRDGSSYYAYSAGESRVVALSDIGITARLFPAGATVFASSLSTGKPLPNAFVRLYSQSNQLVAEGRTGADGLFIVKRGKAWDPQLTPSVATVETQDDLSFLPFDWQTSVALSDTASRDYLESGHEAFVYTPRGVFRPGETVDIKAFVRDAAHAVPTPFPVVFTVMSSRGLEISRGSARLSSEGGAEYSFTLPGSAPTGEYKALLSIPGQDKKILGQVRFSVEDFVPPRLEVTVSPGAEHFTGGGALNLRLSADYLFGAPGADLSYEIGYRAFPRAFSPNGWEGYSFGDAEKNFAANFDLRYITGALGPDGSVAVDFTSPGWQPASVAEVQLIGSVQEDGGRWVTQTAFVTYFPTPYLLGMKLEGDFAPDREGKLLLAAVTPEGDKADPGTLAMEVFEIQGNWHTVYRNGRYVYTWSERFLPVAKSSLQTRDGTAVYSFRPPKHGRYLVRAASEDGSVVASRRVSAWEPGGYSGQDGTGRMDQLELSFDKKEYLPGDLARLSVKAPYAGTLFVGVERAEQVYTRVLHMEQPATVLEIPVSRDMDPNVTVTAWVYRPVQAESKEWYAHRAYGSIPLIMNKTPYRLSVAAQTPERASPNEGLSVPFSVTDADGKPVSGEFSVALVDEGILSLTGFKTPDPLAFFMEQRRSVGRSHDGFDALLRPEAKAAPLLIPGGDTSAEDYQGSLSTQQVFLVGFLPTVRTDENGSGQAFFDIPEYSGKGRLMIVGASGDRFASGASQVRFARDVVVEAAAPRAVAPGDSFEISLKAFAMESGLPGQAEIRVEAQGPLSLTGERAFTLPLAGDEKEPARQSFTVNAKALEASGIAVVSVSVNVPGREDLSFDKTLEVAVRPPYPRVSRVLSALVKAGESQTLAFEDKWVKDTVKTSLSVTDSPAFAVLPALEYLRDYPYGCLEQTISRAWPYLTLTEVQTALYPEADAEAIAANTGQALSSIVTRIASMQTPEGGFGMWPGYSRPHPWKSAHAAFFLVEAKSRVAVPSGTLTRALNYMRFLLAAPEAYFGNKRYAYTTKAYAAFVLARAGEPPLAWMQHLSGMQDAMYPSGRIFLAAAKALKAGNPLALRELKEGDIFPPSPDYGYNESLESPLRNRAVLLTAWSLVAPEDPEASKLCLALAKEIGKARHLTTQNAGSASMAFGYYLGKTKLQAGQHTAVITVGDTILAEDRGGKPLLLGHGRMPLTAEGGPEPLTITVSGKGQAYAVYTARGVSLEPPQAAANDMELVWTWRDPDGKEIDIDASGVTLTRGDKITMEVKLRSKLDVSDVVLSILLPGGLEVENPRLRTSGGESEVRQNNEDYNEEYGYDGEEGDYSARPGNGMFMDLREDRLLLFFDRMYAEADWTTYSFTMRAVSKGEFLIPPVAAEGMYDPEINAMTLPGKLVVE